MAFMRRRTRFVVAIAIFLQVSALLTFAWMKNAFISLPTATSESRDASASAWQETLAKQAQESIELQETTTQKHPEESPSPPKSPDEQPPESRKGPPSNPPTTSTSTPSRPRPPQPPSCDSYDSYSRRSHDPLTQGRHKLPYQRPLPACRTFNSTAIEGAIHKYRDIIKDPDLFQLFHNTFPNTLDTTIKWRGVSMNNSDEELAFVVTGDIDAMWLRDSAQQLHPYSSFITPSEDSDSLASLFRGNINLQARSIAYQPWCNSYTAPEESGIERGFHGAPYQITPYMDMTFCHTPNFELDSFGAFLLTSYDYFSATKDAAFFGKHGWVKAVRQILEICEVQMQPFYNATDGSSLDQKYTFMSTTQIFSATLGIHGLGNPVNYTGMVKAPFRPSDDSAIFQFLVPTNMMLSSYLTKGAEIMEAIQTPEARQLAKSMKEMSKTIRDAIEKYAVVPHPDGSGRSIYAFEVDGYGGQNLMDDANVPSLLSAPLLGYVRPGQPGWQTYINTREFVNSPANPWYSRGPLITGIGSPHTSVGNVWPMALITTILTSDDDGEIVSQLKQLLNTTANMGLMHESVDSRVPTKWTRHWFAWANSYFGQMILDLGERKPHILAMSFQ